MGLAKHHEEIGERLLQSLAGDHVDLELKALLIDLDRRFQAKNKSIKIDVSYNAKLEARSQIAALISALYAKVDQQGFELNKLKIEKSELSKKLKSISQSAERSKVIRKEELKKINKKTENLLQQLAALTKRHQQAVKKS